MYTNTKPAPDGLHSGTVISLRRFHSDSGNHNSPDDISLAQLAEQYAREGFAVFPLTPDSKKPLYGSDGFKSATTDLAKVRGWWAKTPDANIGILPAASSHMVVDFDTKGDGWEDDMRDFLAKHGIEGAVTVRTPSGGRHVWLKLELGTIVPSSAGRLGPGIDVRSDGGYVLAPGSIVDGKRYEGELEPWAIEDAPSALVAAAGTPRARAENAHECLVEEDTPGNVKRAKRFLEQTKPAIEGQGGDHWTVATAALVRERYALSEPVCLELMAEHFNPRCEPPWDMDELAVKVANAYRYASNPAGAGTAEHAFRDVEPAPEPQEGEDDGWGGAMLLDDEVDRIPKLQWLADHAIPRPAVGAIVGRKGSLKSFFAIDMALRVHYGLPWAAGGGHSGYDVEPGTVAYFAGEAPVGIQQRIKAWKTAHPGLKPHGHFAMFNRVPRFRDPKDVKAITKRLLKLRPKLVVIDTLFKAAAGMKLTDEDDASLLVEYAEELRRVLNCTVLFVAHPPKSATKGNDDDVFGSAVIGAGIDFTFHVERPDKGSELIVRNTRQKDVDEIAPMTFRMKSVDVPGLEKPVPVLERVSHMLTAEETAEANFVTAVDEVMAEKPGFEFTSSALAAAIAHKIGGTPKTHGNALTKIVNGKSRIKGADRLRRAYHAGQGKGNAHIWRYDPETDEAE